MVAIATSTYKLGYNSEKESWRWYKRKTLGCGSGTQLVPTCCSWINIEDDVTCIKTKRPDKRLAASTQSVLLIDLLFFLFHLVVGICIHTNHRILVCVCVKVNIIGGRKTRRILDRKTQKDSRVNNNGRLKLLKHYSSPGRTQFVLELALKRNSRGTKWKQERKRERERGAFQHIYIYLITVTYSNDLHCLIGPDKGATTTRLVEWKATRKGEHFLFVTWRAKRPGHSVPVN